MHALLISASLILALSLSTTHAVDIACKDPPAIQFASLTDETNEDYTVGTAVTYACEYGYTLRGQIRTLKCVQLDDEEEPEWTEPQFSCLPQSCGDPGYIPNGRRVGSLFTFPNSVKYECDTGYKLIGLSSRYCQTSGSWSGRLPSCEVVTCNPPKDPENGYVTYDSLEFGSELNYKCETGFLLSTDKPVFCTSEGRWSEADVRCIEAACDLPSAPEHGFMQLLSSSDKPRAGSLAIFSCEEDRIIDGPANSKCLENGQWTFPAPKCLEPCSIPYVNEGIIGRYVKQRYSSRTKVFTEVSVGTQVEEGEELSIRCSEGYELVNLAKREEKVVCRKGKWSNELLCVPAPCRRNLPPAEKVGIVSKNNEHGGKVIYVCFRDFRKIRNETIVCDFGHWKGEVPLCKDTRCSLDLLKFNGLVKGRKSSYNHGELFEVECEPGYQVSKTGILRCEDGEWKGHLPPCNPESCKEPPPPIDHARAEISSMTHGSPVKYICEYPYVLVQSSPIQCLFGKWDGQRPRCEDGRCNLKDLEKSSHVSVESPSFTSSGFELNVVCKPGYSPGKEKPLCQHGKWTRNWASPCKENGCSVPRLYNGDVIQETTGDYYWNWKYFRYERDLITTKIPYGGRVSPATSYLLSCHNGYSFQGTQTRKRGITCTEGRWIPNPVCLRVGTRYIPPTTRRVPTTSKEVLLRTSPVVPSIHTHKTTPAFEFPTTTRKPFVEDSSEEKLDEVTSSATPKVVDCSCEYPISDEKLVASVDGKRLQLLDKVPDGTQVVFRCKHVGFHRLSGPHENKCENCGRWQTTFFPTCSEPRGGNAVILFDDKINISVEGNLEVRKGQNVRLSCVAMESALYPLWSVPSEDGIRRIPERKERKTYGDILYVSHLEIDDTDFKNEGRYECGVGDNAVTVVHLTVIDPDVRCPAFQEQDSISVLYEMERRMNSKAFFSCSNPSQEIVGKASLTCLRNGEWSDPPPYCQNMKCETLKEDDMLQIYYTNDREVGSMATFHCFAPAKRSGVSFATCLKNGLWSDPTPSCTNPPCHVEDLFPALPPDVLPEMDDVTNNTLPYDKKIRLTCQDDLIAIDEHVARCAKNRTWEVPKIYCISGCPPLQKPPESKLIVKPERFEYKLGEMVTYSCPPGMDLNTDSQLIMCLKNGWSETVLPECESNKDYNPYEAKSQDNDQGDIS